MLEISAFQQSPLNTFKKQKLLFQFNAGNFIVPQIVFFAHIRHETIRSLYILNKFELALNISALSHLLKNNMLPHPEEPSPYPDTLQILALF